MADDDNDGEESSSTSSGDSMQRYMETINRLDREDQAEVDRDDGVGTDEGDEEGTTSADEQDDDTEEHTDAGTSSDNADGQDDESEDDSTEDDATGHADDDSDPDDDDDDADTDDDEDVTDETKAALAKHGAILTLEDVPEAQRATVEALLKPKLRNIDAAFSRAQAEATSFRAKAREVEAEERFRREHPDMYIAELLAKDPDLIDRVNARVEKNGDPDQKKVFDILARDARKEAADAVTAEETAYDRRMNRGQEVETLAKTQAKARGLPWDYAERAVYRALLEKPEATRDLTTEEVVKVIAEEAEIYAKHRRSVKRDASREIVKNRSTARKSAPPAARTPGSAVSPRPAVQKVKVDHSSEVSRQAAILRTLRRVAPGTR